MDRREIKIESLLVIKNLSRRRMVRIIGEKDYENFDTKEMGFLFGLFDADMANENVKLFDIVNEGIIRYYKNILEHDIAFDDLINFLNRRIVQMFPEQNVKEKCSAVIGVLKNNKLLFCASGAVNAFLAHPHGVKKIYPEEEERTMDVSSKLFTYALNGEISKNNFVYFCNRDFKEIINPYELGKAVHALGAANVIASIKDYLLDSGKDGAYGSVWLYNENSKPEAAAGDSVLEIFKKEKATENELSPSIMNSFGSAIKDRPVLADLLKFAGKLFKKSFQFLKKSLFFIGFLVFNSFFILTNARGKRKEKQLAVNDKFRGYGFKIKGVYNSLTAVSKIAFLCLLLLVGGLISAIVWSSHAQKIKELRASYAQNMETAENLYNEADADVIFQQKNVAIRKLKSAAGLLDLVPEKIRDASYAELALKVQDKLFKLQNITQVNAPIVLADFAADTQKNPNVFPPIYLFKGKINLFNNEEAISVDTKTQTVSRSPFKVATAGFETYFYYAQKSAVYVLSAENSLQITYADTLASDSKEVVLSPTESILKFALYNDLMYTISPVDKSFYIWKHSPSLSGFGKPTLWATGNLPEGAAPAGLALDGNLYALFSNNQIYKYYQGKKLDWNYDPEQIPNSARYVKILTSEDYQNVYLAGGNVVSVMSKDGDFLAHAVLPGLSDIQDIAVDENTNTIYALDGKKIYAFTYNL